MKFEPRGPERFRHQKAGLQKMIQTGGVTALLFDPGLGKTAVVLDYASILALKAPSGEARVLVVCPLAAVDTWVMQSALYVSDQVNVWAEALGGSILQRAQALSSRGGNPVRGTPAHGPKNAPQGRRAAHWGLSYAQYARSVGNPAPEPSEGPDGLGSDRPRLVLEVINLDTLSSRARAGRGTMADVVVDAIRRFNPDLMVLDESHKAKGVSGNASRVLSRLSDYVKRRAILTGTVMPHSPLDVFAQWRFLQPYAFGTRLADGSVKRATFGEFKDRYAVMGGWMGREVLSFRDLDHMQDVMAQNAVVARKEDALDLPPTTTVTIPVHLSQAEKAAYKQMTDALVISLPTLSATANNRLTQMMRLRQITSGFMPDDSGVMKELGASKVNTIRSLVQDTLTGEKRIVIFALFTHEIELLRRALTGEQGTEVMTISGATSMSDRVLMRKRFGSDDSQRMVMIAQVKTMSLAVNELVSANHAIFASLSQQRDDLVQAQDRLNRIGQTRPVTFWYCLAPGTVDGVIMQSHHDRTDLEDAMLHHIAQVHETGL